MATGSYGVHVKHLHNLVNFYHQGVLEANKRFALPPDPSLFTAAPSASAAASTAGLFAGAIPDPNGDGIGHELSFELDTTTGRIRGTTSWPANPARNLPEREFSLTGTVDESGRITAQDNTPEIIPGFNRGIYIGTYQQGSKTISGQYLERDPATGEDTYWGDWVVTRG